MVAEVRFELTTSGYEGEIAQFSEQQLPTTGNEISEGRELLSAGFGWLCTQFTDTYTDIFGPRTRDTHGQFRR